MEGISKSFENKFSQEGIEKPLDGKQDRELPEEIFCKPDHDSIPPWLNDKENLDASPNDKGFHTVPKEILEKPQLDTVPPWRNETGTSLDSSLNGSQIDSLSTRNKDLEGKRHPKTDVPYERKEIKKENGETDEGVFPVFDSVFDAQLPEELYKETDAKQEKECNEQLKEAIEKDPELAEKFTPEQLEQIKNGDTPDGYTWHHNEETGKMQLVDSETHAKTGHTGGKAIWGGGEEYRR